MSPRPPLSTPCQACVSPLPFLSTVFCFLVFFELRPGLSSSRAPRTPLARPRPAPVCSPVPAGIRAPAAPVAGPSPRGFRSPTAPVAMPARLPRLGLGPSGPQDPGSAAQGSVWKVAGEGRGRREVPPSHRWHPTCRVVRAPVGPWGPRSPCSGRRRHPTPQEELSSHVFGSPLFFGPELTTHPSRA